MAFLLLFCIQAAAQQSPDSLSIKEREKLKERKAPMGALLRSVAVPGWGQFYNGKYIKATIICAAESYFIYRAAYWWDKTEDQYGLIQNLPVDERPPAFSTYDSYRGKRNDFLWLVGVTVFVSMFDAYVDAHLSGFNVDLTPDFESKKPEVSLKLCYHF